MKETLLTPFAKIMTDIALLILLLACYITGETGVFEANWSIWVSTHAIVGILMCSAMGLHVWQHWRMIKAFTKKKVILRNFITFLSIVFFVLVAFSILFMIWPTHSTLEIHHAVSILFTKLMFLHAILQFPSMMRQIRRNRANKAVCVVES